jgi:hypothetical protein
MAVVRVLLPNRPRVSLLRGGWASKRFLVVIRGDLPCCWTVVMMIIRDVARWAAATSVTTSCDAAWFYFAILTVSLD